MPNDELDFARVKPIGDSRRKGFEELCCQLAALEPQPTGSIFRRNGEGPDGGVECFWKHPDGFEAGWQAKYVFRLGSNELRQINESLDSALLSRPSLTVFIVCLPFDLRDGRRPGIVTELERFETWRERRIAAAEKLGRSLAIQLWSASTLLGRLTRDTAAYAGKRRYWFDDRLMMPAWFRERMAGPVADLHDRYQPDNHVDLSIFATLKGLTRDADVLDQARAWADRLTRGFEPLRRAAGRDDALAIDVRRLITLSDRLINALSAPLDVWDTQLPIGEWEAMAADLVAELGPLTTLAWGRESSGEHHRWRREFFDARSALDDVADAWAAGSWSLVNSRRLLLWGDAGSGKSHLLAAFAEARLAAGYPTLFALGGGLRDGDPWRQLLAGWDLPGETVEVTLAALEAAAEAAGGPALIVIDAINEGEGPAIWRGRLRGVLDTLARFPKISVILSCRSIYLPVLGLDTPIAGLQRLEHPGFEDDDAATRYLIRRGVHGPGLPDLGLELSNPLFLKTCCDLLERKGQTAFPRGMQGVTAIFDFYAGAVAEELQSRLALDPFQDIPRRAIRAIATALAETPGGRLALADASAVLETVYSSGGRREHSLLHNLVSEGVLSTEWTWERAGAGQAVRFTFERFGDHQIASRILEGLSRDEVEARLTAGDIFERLFGAESWRWAGVHEAIAVQLPERFCLEVLDLDLGDNVRHILIPAFRSSLFWRDAAAFSERTLALVGSDRERWSVLLLVATEPANQFNAQELDARLGALGRAERDRVWSTLVASQGLGRGGARALIAWGLSGAPQADPERVRLGTIALAWLLTTSHRAVRDRATKALSALLTGRLDLAGDLVERFIGLDDLYVPERVLAATFGAAVASKDDAALERLAGRVWDSVFAAGAPPLHLLLRDYAAGVIEYADHRGRAPERADIERLHGPFQSAWPLEDVSEADLEPFNVSRARDGMRWTAILSSCSDHGDFGRYVIAYRSKYWSRRPVIDAGLDAEALWLRFMGGFEGPPEAVDALMRYFSAELEVMEMRAGCNASPETKAAKAAAVAGAREARHAAEAMMSESQLHDWRTGAARFARAGFDPDRASLPFLDLEPIRRWVTKRAYDLGWTPDRFDAFESSGTITHDRMTHTVERIGKKYQWLALHEAMARAADNVAPLGEGYASALETYGGAWPTGLRDLDPTMLATAMMEREGARWWLPVAPEVRARTAAEAMAWLDSGQDLVSNSKMLEVTGTDGVTNLVLHAFHHSRAQARPPSSETAEPETWGRVDALVVRQEDKAALVARLGGRHWTGNHELPRYESQLDVCVGELAWRPPFSNWTDWLEPPVREWPARGEDPGPAVRSCSFEYVAERMTFDASLDDDIRVQLPAPWLVELLSLTLSDAVKLTFVDPSGRRIFFDPGMAEGGPSAALIEKATFEAALAREKLELVWVVVGEKSVYGQDHDGFGGRRLHTTIYHRERGCFIALRHESPIDAAPEQLDALYSNCALDDDPAD